jgi:hypothetical protein
MSFLEKQHNCRIPLDELGPLNDRGLIATKSILSGPERLVM